MQRHGILDLSFNTLISQQALVICDNVFTNLTVCDTSGLFFLFMSLGDGAQIRSRQFDFMNFYQFSIRSIKFCSISPINNKILTAKHHSTVNNNYFPYL